MGFAVSSRFTAAGIAAEAKKSRRLQLENRTSEDRRPEFEAFQRLLNEEAWKDEAKTSIEGLRRRNKAPEILKDIAAQSGFSVSDLKGPSRIRPLVAARQRAVYEIRRQCPHLSLPQIGRILGGRDHTTALHSLRAWPIKAEKLGIPCEPLKEPT